MPGAHLQLLGRGAQDILVTGNPSFTHFRSVYKRHTDFAMEHFRLYFKTSILSYPSQGSLTLRTKVEKYGQLLSDCYLSMDLPNIYSPAVDIPSSISPDKKSRINTASDAIGYEFQWCRNIGYNMIRHVSVLINGQEIVRHTGEWMKIYANLTFDANKREILNRMVGNLPDLYDPANAEGRMHQYPHAISKLSSPAEPSIYGRTLLIPLHFWFCESIGKALPLIALQNSDVEIVVELRNMYELFTIRDVRSESDTFAHRIAPDTSDPLFSMRNFLSPAHPTQNIASNTSLTTWNMNPFIEANYVFVNDQELAYLAKTEHSFMISQVDVVQKEGQAGPSNDMELTMKNLCTRIVWAGQRSDRILLNDHDNYTNWKDPYNAPIDSNGLGWVTSGTALAPNVSQRDILLESTLILDGKERFAPKQTLFFSGLQLFKHQTGNPIPGIYEYSFEIKNDPIQPSGHLNGSMFNKTILRNTLVLPPFSSDVVNEDPANIICVLKSTATSMNPIVVNPNAVDSNGNKLYGPEDVVTIIRKAADRETFEYTFTLRAYVESYNFLRILSGLGNIVFSS